MSGVFALFEHLAGIIPSRSRFLERHAGEYAQREPLFLVAVSVFEPPPIAAGGRDFEIEAARIKQPLGLALGFEITDRALCKHGYNSEGCPTHARVKKCPHVFGSCPQICPQDAPAVNERHRTAQDEKNPR